MAAKYHAVVMAYLAGGMLGGSVVLALGFERLRDAVRARKLPKWLMELGDHDNVMKAEYIASQKFLDSAKKVSESSSGQHAQDAKFRKAEGASAELASIRALVDDAWMQREGSYSVPSSTALEQPQPPAGEGMSRSGGSLAEDQGRRAAAVQQQAAGRRFRMVRSGSESSLKEAEAADAGATRR